ncbi:MAG: HD domain-containing phosphohydrolase [Verrucomicrobiota bacterium]|jgi:response regulator RpfG family c-di-GMP phosphodiesterase
MNLKILFVDDEANVLSGFQRSLRKDFALNIALGGEPALRMMEEHGPYAIIVSDMQMPGMNGLELLAKVEALAPDTVRMVLTGNADQKTAVDAVNRGHIFRFMTKPCKSELLAEMLKAGLKQYGLITAERELLEKTLHGSIKALTDILSMFDPQSFSRAQRLRDYMSECARSFNIARPWELEMAAMLSPIGLVTIPPDVLKKKHSNQDLSSLENDLLAHVPEIGFTLLSNIPRLEAVALIVRYQAKNYDGSGYPNDDLAGESIPIGSRILRVLSDLILYENHNASKINALSKMRQCPGHYDPKVLDFVAAAFDVFVPALSREILTSRPITFKELRVGHMLMSDVVTRDGLKIIIAGAPVTSVLLAKLRNFASLSGIQEPILVSG